MDRPLQTDTSRRWSPAVILCLVVLPLVALVAFMAWLLGPRRSMRYSFTEDATCLTQLWVRSLRADAGELAYEITFDVSEKKGGAVTEAEFIVFDDANHNARFDAGDETIVEYHMGPGSPQAKVRCGPLVARWRTAEMPTPYLLTKYAVNGLSRGSGLTALFDVAAIQPPALSQSATQPASAPGE